MPTTCQQHANNIRKRYQRHKPTAATLVSTT